MKIQNETSKSFINSNQIIESQINHKLQIYQNNLWLSITIQIFFLIIIFGSQITPFWFEFQKNSIPYKIGLIYKPQSQPLEYEEIQETTCLKVQWMTGIITFTFFSMANLLQFLQLYYKIQFIFRVQQNISLKTNKYVRIKTIQKIILYMYSFSLFYWVIVTSINWITYYPSDSNFGNSFYFFIGFCFGLIPNQFYFQYFKGKVHQKELFTNLLMQA